MAAAQAVLGTCELLEMVIECLPSIDTTRVMRVAKAWQTSILESPRIHNQRIPRPVAEISPYVDKGPGTPRLLYNVDTKIAFHSCVGATHAVNVHQRGSSSGTSVNFVWIHLHNADRGLLGPHMEEFATTPPVQAVQLTVGFISQTWSIRPTSVVYVRSGVKVRDLVEVANDMRDTGRRYTSTRYEKIKMSSYYYLSNDD